MRPLKQSGRIFTASAAATAILFATVVICADHAQIPLSWSSPAWELAFKDGRVRLENQPRVRLEADRYAAALAKVEKDSDERESASRKILKQEPWGSPKYEEALKE